MNRRPSNAFWRGFLAAVCCHSLLADALGQEWFADPTNWVDASITVPLAIFGLLLCWGSYEGEEFVKELEK